MILWYGKCLRIFFLFGLPYTSDEEAFTKLEQQQPTAVDDAADVMSDYDPLNDDSMQGC